MKPWRLKDLVVKDGMVEGPDGVVYGMSGDVPGAFASAVLDFCGCGSPEAALEWVARGLDLIQGLRECGEDGRGWNAAYEAWEKRKREHFGSEGAEYFFWYWCDTNDLTEHGGSVPGWLSGRGYEVREDIHEALSSLRGAA